MMAVSNADRRTILGAGALVIGAGAVGSGVANAQGGEQRQWQPMAEEQDDWLDIPGTRHRMVFDTTNAEAAAGGIRYANNFYLANEEGYAIGADQLGVVLILRAESTPFGYSDAVWAKYGKAFVGMLKLEGDRAKTAEQANPLLASASPAAPTLGLLHGKGTKFAICGMATRGISQGLAHASGEDAAAVEAYLKANLIPGALIVPAGIVAVNRAQEHGYAFAYVQG
jgi:intracellular sulfur oxidation DsrE/DsrF family protein